MPRVMNDHYAISAARDIGLPGLPGARIVRKLQLHPAEMREISTRARHQKLLLRDSPFHSPAM